jgi:hypothetical protein
MGIAVHQFQSANGNVGVNLRSGNILVPKNLLEKPEFGTVFQHQRGHRMAEQVRSSNLTYICGFDVVMDNSAQMITADSSSIKGEKLTCPPEISPVEM